MPNSHLVRSLIQHRVSWEEGDLVSAEKQTTFDGLLLVNLFSLFLAYLHLSVCLFNIIRLNWLYSVYVISFLMYSEYPPRPHSPPPPPIPRKKVFHMLEQLSLSVSVSAVVY